ncbi:MAG: DUF6279 family lipoprotein [Caldimonas sp.]
MVATVLGGCSLIKVGYGQASPFAFRWLDRYVDFDDAQSLRVRTALDEWFAWNRRTQLPDYADLLARASAEVLLDSTPERMCGWATEIRGRIDVALERALPTIADVLPTLAPAQIVNVEQRYKERNEEYRDEYVQRNPEKRSREAVKRATDRAQMLYGDLDATQRELVVRSVAASPFDAELAYSERLRRQRDSLALMRNLSAPGARRDDAEAQIRAYVRRLDRSPREPYRVYSERLVAYNCAFAATLHNATSPGQRRDAAKKLKGYETSLRELAAEAT